MNHNTCYDGKYSPCIFRINIYIQMKLLLPVDKFLFLKQKNKQHNKLVQIQNINCRRMISNIQG